ncbi:MAG: helix-turn-helix domain-containing protein, partial [Eubacterium sp.]|nr:helix-turn-helix domain-containing protein [Eubacterium sp.]
MKDKTVNRTPFGTKIRALRKSKGLKQREVAEAIGIKENNYRKYETSTIPRKDTLVKIAAFYGVTIDYLMGRTDNKFGEEKKIITTYSEKENDINYIFRQSQEEIEVVENNVRKVSNLEALVLDKLQSISP